MARYHHTQGICLRRVAYSNTSQVAGFLTRDGGRLSFMAKGVTRAPKKGIRTGFDLLGLYDLVFTVRRSSSLHNLTQRSLVDGFRGIRATLERTLCGYYAAELALNFTIEGQPCPDYFRLIRWGLERLAAGGALGVTVLALELGSLHEHGSLPTFAACAVCGGPLPVRGGVRFSAPDGGALCRRCESGGDRYRRGDVKVARAEHLTMLSALAESDPTETETLSVRPQDTLAMSALVRHHVRYLLGKELRMWRYLERRHMSRSLRAVRSAAGVE